MTVPDIDCSCDRGKGGGRGDTEKRERGMGEEGGKEGRKGEREWCLGKVPNISTYVINISFGRNFL